MIEFSPKVPSEPLPSRVNISAFNKSTLSFLSATPKPYKTSLPIMPKKEIASCPMLSSNIKSPVCKCPEILIADDDDFQEFYYQTLFSKSLDFTHVPFQKKSLKLEVFKSGEALIRKYNELNDCGCKPVLIILDYNMGRNNMNGVQVAQMLRRYGYDKPIVLRTSENEAYLSRVHKNFEELLRTRIIDRLLDKTHHLQTKEALQYLIKDLSK